MTGFWTPNLCHKSFPMRVCHAPYSTERPASILSGSQWQITVCPHSYKSDWTITSNSLIAIQAEIP